METSENETLIRRHRLTPFRFLRGLICLVVFLSTAFMFLVYFAPIATLFFRLFSLRYSRKVTSFLFSLWLALWPFLFEVINGTKVVFSGDNVPGQERVLLLANHRTEVDWMYLWDLALRKGCLGSIKYVLKSSLMKLPLFGWGFHVLEFIPVERKWEIDEPVLRNTLSSFTDPRDPLWLAVFPEGTDFNEQKSLRSKKFAVENGLPVLENLLLPKTKGFFACLEVLRGSLDAVYDVTIAYKHDRPSFSDNVFGLSPLEVHIHIHRIPLKEIPTSESALSAWLMDKFAAKDQLLSNFTADGHFPKEGRERGEEEEELSVLKCSANFLVVISLTAIFSYLTLFSSIWFKVYVGLSCAYLAYSTHFNVQVVPVFGSVVEMFCHKKHRGPTD